MNCPHCKKPMIDNADWVSAWDGFIEMRKKIKKPLTGRAEILALRKLNGISKDVAVQIKVLDQSTFNDYQGLFPLKQDLRPNSAAAEKWTGYDD